MTAESAQHVMWTPDPMRQRLADYTVEDILLLPDDAPRCELTDGVITTLPLPTAKHQSSSKLCRRALGAATGWHVHAYDLVDGGYEPAGDSDEVLRLSKPFAIEVPIREIAP